MKTPSQDPEARAAGSGEGKGEVGSDLGIPDFHLIKRIGRGSYGQVWLARSATGSYRAVKVVFRESFGADKPYEREFSGIQEFEPISRAHPGQLDILHVGRNDEDGFFYYVMELADDAAVKATSSGSITSADGSSGGATGTGTRRKVQPETYEPATLQKYLAENGRLGGMDCLEMAIELTEALGHLHTNGLVHRDIKPSNIIFVRGRAKLADIGLVAHAEEKLSIVGTEGFLPPEGPGQPTADLYSLGKVFYEMATGTDRRKFPKLPEPCEDAREQRAFIEFNEIILRCCERSAENRYQSAADLLTDLNLLRQGRSIRRLRAVERRLVLMRRISLVGIATTAVIFGGYLYQRSQTQRLTAVAESRDQERKRAQAGELMVRRHLYAADINLVQRIQESDPARALRLLNRHRPQPGQIDLRGWEWRYLWQRCQSDAERTLGRHSSRIYSVAYSPDGESVVAGDLSGGVTIWNVATGEPESLQAGGSTHTTPAVVAFSPQGEVLATVETNLDGEAKVILWDWPSRMRIGVLPHPAKVTSLCFFPDGGGLVTTAIDKVVRVWDLPSGQERWSVPFRYALGVYASEVAVSPKGDLLAIGGTSGRLWIRDAESGAEQLTWIGHEDGGVTALAFSPDGGSLASGSGYQHSSVKLWDPATGEEVATLAGHSRWVSSLAFSSDGEVLASGSADGSIRLWNPRTGQARHRLQGTEGEVQALGFDPGDERMVSGTLNGVLSIWKTERAGGEGQHKVIPRDQLGIEFVERITGRGQGLRLELKAVSPDKRIAVEGNPDQLDGALDWIETGNHRSSEITRIRHAHRGLITCFVFTPDSKFLISVGEDGMARIWNTVTKREERVLISGISWSVDVSSDGKRILIQGPEKAVTVWDFHTGQELITLDVEKRVRSIGFAPGGRQVLGFSGSEVHLWSAPSFAEIEESEPKDQSASVP